MGKNRKDLVHYCPGSAVGTLATMPRLEAEAYLNSDSKFIEIMQRAGAMEAHPALPHIGGTCKKCRRDHGQ
jgi:hypothetical protein